MMKDIISAQKEDHLFNIKILQNPCCYDKTNIEAKISKQLDFYLDNYSDEMQKIPINSLYNIFYNKERILSHPVKAYDFISNSNDPEKYILLESIDGISLYNESPEKFSDSLSKNGENYNYLPKMEKSFLSEKIKPGKQVQNAEIKEMISSNRFKELRFKIYKEQITYVKFPKHTIEIPDYSFFRCNSLTEVITSKNLNKIGKFAFFQCTSLTSIYIPSSCSIIEQSAFSGCTNLINFSIPTALKELKSAIFDGCESLTEIMIPYGIHTIEMRALSSCVKIRQLIIPDSVTNLHSWSMHYNSSLVEVKLPSNIERIEGILEGCVNLEKVTLPSKLNTIGAICFAGCKSLKRIDIPPSVIKIEHRAFDNCVSLKEIQLPPKLKNLGDNAFCHCSSLEKVVLSNELEIIPSNCFNGCSMLNNIVFHSSVNEIKECAFCGCKSLTHFTFPSSVTKIGYFCFYGCSSLVGIYAKQKYANFFFYFGVFLKKVRMICDVKNDFFFINYFLLMLLF